EEREPGVLSWYFVTGTEPVRTIVPDPFATWELRTHFGQPAEPPRDAPRTIEQKRIAHNVAVAGGEVAPAAERASEIQRALVSSRSAYEDGTEILGTTFVEGARPLLTIFLKAGGAQPPGVELVVRSEVIAKAALSTTMADPTKRDV